MTNEEAIGRIQDHMRHHGIGQYPHLKLKEAFDMAINALRNQPTGDPLTLERMREMEKAEPVWWEDARFWCLAQTGSIITPSGQCYDADRLPGKFYAYPPAHIDREAFGCQFCNGKFCGNCLYDALPVQMEPCRSCESHSKWETDYRFCPHCGRPMTEEAWAELEKRLRG